MAIAGSKAGDKRGGLVGQVSNLPIVKETLFQSICMLVALIDVNSVVICQEGFMCFDKIPDL